MAKIKIASAIASYTAENGVTGTSISQTMSSLTSTPSLMAGRVCHIYILLKVTCLAYTKLALKTYNLKK